MCWDSANNHLVNVPTDSIESEIQGHQELNFGEQALLINAHSFNPSISGSFEVGNTNLDGAYVSSKSAAVKAIVDRRWRLVIECIH